MNSEHVQSLTDRCLTSQSNAVGRKEGQRLNLHCTVGKVLGEGACHLVEALQLVDEIGPLLLPSLLQFLELHPRKRTRASIIQAVAIVIPTIKFDDTDIDNRIVIYNYGIYSTNCISKDHL